MKIFQSKKDILIFIVIVFVILVTGFFSLRYLLSRLPKEVLIITEKAIYQPGENLKLSIKNISPVRVCFSSCYPYFLERKDREWKEYLYENCPHPDLVKNCLNSNSEKFFELDLPVSLESALHRMKVPVCFNCKENQEFKKENIYYSNPFLVK